MSCSEFELIERFFAPLSTYQSNDLVSLGIGDDGAVLNCDPEFQYVVVTDTLIEGVHFPFETAAGDVAWKSLAVNLSDLAAMGADPLCYSLALSLPSEKNSEEWLSAFSQGLQDLTSLFPIPLIGGDTTRSDRLVVTVTAHGKVPVGQAVLRSEAKSGDLIYVTGGLGLAGFALDQYFRKKPLTHEESLALNRPMPRLIMSSALRQFATAAIDVSDGFLADLMHILRKSGVSAELDFSQFPFPRQVAEYLQTSHKWAFPLTCGDDYEICCTVESSHSLEFESMAKQLGCSVSRVGRIRDGQTSEISFSNTPDDWSISMNELGYNHYRK